MGGILQGIINPATYFPPAATTDRVVGVGAGTGQTGNRVFMAGQNAGQFTQQSDMVLIGNSVMSAGTQIAPITDANWAGSTIIGSQAAPVVVNASGLAGGVNAPSTIIGFNNYKVTTGLTGETALGANILTTWGGNAGNFPTNNVLVGGNIGLNLVAPNSGSGNGYASNVVVGFGAAKANLAGQSKTVQLNVVIGFNAGQGIVGNVGTGGPGVSQNVIIGASAGNLIGNVDSVTGSTNNVFIGYQCSDAGNTRSNVFVGSGTASGVVGGGSTNNLALGGITTGGANHVTGTDRNTTIGTGVQIPSTVSRCIVVGSGAGAGSAVANANDQFLIETYDGVTRRVMLYGVMCDGATAGTGLIFGFSTNGTNRDIQGTNTFKILNGSKGGVNPNGGGYFYVTAGALHWVGSAGTDTAIAVA